MGLTVDKLVGPLIHGHRIGDITIDGDLDMGTNKIILTDSNGVDWELTVNTSGTLVTTQVVTTDQGKPYGLLLALTQPS